MFFISFIGTIRVFLFESKAPYFYGVLAQALLATVEQEFPIVFRKNIITTNIQETFLKDTAREDHIYLLSVCIVGRVLLDRRF